MWKKDEVTPDQPVSPSPSPSPSVARRSADAISGGSNARSRASIGSSITIRGEVTGDEDLLIEGRIDGSVDLKQHSVTVGAEGQVKAGIAGRVVTVEGTVNGDLRAEEMVVLRSGAHVQGDITAPRVVLEDGATFRGAVDMGEKADTPKRSAVRPNGEVSTSTSSGAGKGKPGSDASSTEKGTGGQSSDTSGAKAVSA